MALPRCAIEEAGGEDSPQVADTPAAEAEPDADGGAAAEPNPKAAMQAATASGMFELQPLPPVIIDPSMGHQPEVVAQDDTGRQQEDPLAAGATDGTRAIEAGEQLTPYVAGGDEAAVADRADPTMVAEQSREGAAARPSDDVDEFLARIDNTLLFNTTPGPYAPPSVDDVDLFTADALRRGEPPEPAERSPAYGFTDEYEAMRDEYEAMSMREHARRLRAERARDTRMISFLAENQGRALWLSPAADEPRIVIVRSADDLALYRRAAELAGGTSIEVLPNDLTAVDEFLAARDESDYPDLAAHAREALQSGATMIRVTEDPEVRRTTPGDIWNYFRQLKYGEQQE